MWLRMVVRETTVGDDDGRANWTTVRSDHGGHRVRHRDHCVSIAPQRSLDALKGRVEGAGAKTSLLIDERGVDFKDEGHAESTGQGQASQVTERVALVDDVGAREFALIVRPQQIRESHAGNGKGSLRTSRKPGAEFMTPGQERSSHCPQVNGRSFGTVGRNPRIGDHDGDSHRQLPDAKT